MRTCSCALGFGKKRVELNLREGRGAMCEVEVTSGSQLEIKARTFTWSKPPEASHWLSHQQLRSGPRPHARSRLHTLQRLLLMKH